MILLKSHTLLCFGLHFILCRSQSDNVTESSTESSEVNEVTTALIELNNGTETPGMVRFQNSTDINDNGFTKNTDGSANTTDMRPIIVAFTALYPKGLRVYVLDYNMTVVKLYGAVNTKLHGYKPGHLKLCTHSVPNKNVTGNRYWLLQNKNIKLNKGDTIYYWIQTYGQRIFISKIDAEAEIKTIFYLNNTVLPENVVTTELPTVMTPTPARRCNRSVSAVQSKAYTCKGELLFEEHFTKKINYLKPSALNFWAPEVMFLDKPDFPFNFYSLNGTIRVLNGSLIISPVLLAQEYNSWKIHGEVDLSESCTGRLGSPECARAAAAANILPPVMTGKVTTRQRFSFKYGRVEVRARLPAGDWLFPEITLEPLDSVYGLGRGASGLARVAFTRGNARYRSSLSAGVVLAAEESRRHAFLFEKKSGEGWTEEFHNYSLVWRPDGISMFVDEEQYGFIEPEAMRSWGEAHNLTQAQRWRAGSPMAPFDEFFYISLGLRVGGLSDFPDTDDKPYTNRGTKAMLRFWEAKHAWLPTWDDGSLAVDSVRVYAI
ncbi:beta-1,3-glucan-binding protein-like [Plutella xylostella]|uniref:beta-1,3-glucan-binding protein-like n=1 Tax=Plutella xylostella TaxID=51655 RepID=UPI002032384F|nr:beta-1,3-glucan-binding protein-like [Plutella xylostella]